MASVKIIDHSAEVREAIDKGIEKGLEMVGLKAEGIAKRLAPVDTGLLRNSITHFASGQSFSYTYTDNKDEQSGTYAGVKGDERDQCMYIGTNVEYAAYVEKGTSRTPAQPFLQPAAEDHVKTYAKMLGDCIKEALNS